MPTDQILHYPHAYKVTANAPVWMDWFSIHTHLISLFNDFCSKCSTVWGELNATCFEYSSPTYASCHDYCLIPRVKIHNEWAVSFEAPAYDTQRRKYKYIYFSCVINSIMKSRNNIIGLHASVSSSTDAFFPSHQLFCLFCWWKHTSPCQESNKFLF